MVSLSITIKEGDTMKPRCGSCRHFVRNGTTQWYGKCHYHPEDYPPERYEPRKTFDEDWCESFEPNHKNPITGGKK